MNTPPLSDAMLDTLQRRVFEYFQHKGNPANGLIRDKTKKDWPASIAGLALAAYPVGGGAWIDRSGAVQVCDPESHSLIIGAEWRG